MIIANWRPSHDLRLPIPCTCRNPSASRNFETTTETMNVCRATARTCDLQFPRRLRGLGRMRPRPRARRRRQGRTSNSRAGAVLFRRRGDDHADGRVAAPVYQLPAEVRGTSTSRTRPAAASCRYVYKDRNLVNVGAWAVAGSSADAHRRIRGGFLSRPITPKAAASGGIRNHHLVMKAESAREVKQLREGAESG